jgi:hypothetical protein
MADERRDVYFEHIAIGNSVKVTAIDGATAIEVSVVGPVHAAQSDLERLALQKLRARLAREAKP